MKNTANKLRIVHRGVAQLHNGESAQPGLAAVLTNMREREDALEVVGNPRSIDQLELGDSMLLVDDDRTLVLRDGNVVWNNVVVLNTAATVISAHKVGAMLVVVTSEGNVVMRRTASGYSTLNIDSALPQLHLSAVEQQAMTTTIPAFEFDQPYTAWQAPLATADVEAYSRLVRNAVATMQRSAASQGRFTGVMLVRYAVRLWDDSYLWVSQPLMVGHSLISANYRSTATVTSSNNRFTGTEAFSLEVNSYRLGISVAQGIAAELFKIVIGKLFAASADIRCDIGKNYGIVVVLEFFVIHSFSPILLKGIDLSFILQYQTCHMHSTQSYYTLFLILFQQIICYKS